MRYEIKKLLTPGILLLLGVCIIINAYLFYSQQMPLHGELLEDYDYYTGLIDQLVGNPDLDLDNIREEDETGAHGISIYRAEEQQKHLRMYPGFIREMPQRAEEANRLIMDSQSGFARRNISKTTHDFQGMDALPLKAGMNIAVDRVYRFPLSDIIIWTFLIILCVKLFSHEFERGLYPLILATPSRLTIAIQKLLSQFFLPF